MSGDDESAPDPMQAGTWHSAPGVCGSCIAWRPDAPRPGETVASGTCRLRPELPRVPATLKLCSLYKPRGGFVYQPGKSAPAKKRSAPAKVVRRNAEGEMVRETRYENRSVELGEPRDRTPPPRPPAPKEVDVGTDNPLYVRQLLVEVFREELSDGRRELMPRYKGGAAEIVAVGEKYTMPMEQFFSYLDRFRSALDELEDAICRQDPLGDVSELRGQIARIQGTMSTFNILFADKLDHFSG